MGKISNQVSKGLAGAIAEVQAQLGGDTIVNELNTENSAEELLNSGVKAKRKRRTKAEMQAAKEQEANSLNESNDENEPQVKQPQTHEEFCAMELQKAIDKGLPEPDFDFRNYYHKGQPIWYVQVLHNLGEKYILPLKIRTLYPRVIVGVEQKSCCQCIGYDAKDMIFETYQEASACFNSIQVTPKYAPEERKSGRKKRKGTDKEVDEEEGLDEAYTSLEEVEEDG